MKVTITPNSKIEKREDGIYVDNQQVLVKDYAIYGLCFLSKFNNKEEAAKLYEEMAARDILLKIAALYNN